MKTNYLKASVLGILAGTVGTDEKPKEDAFSFVEVTEYRYKTKDKTLFFPVLSLYVNKDLQTPYYDMINIPNNLNEDMNRASEGCGNLFNVLNKDEGHDDCHSNDPRSDKEDYHRHYVGGVKEIECMDQSLREKYEIPM